MMKVCLVGPFPTAGSDVKGGVASVVSALAHGLASMGCDVHVVMTSGGSGGAQGADGDGVRVHQVARSRLPGFLTYSSINRARIHRKLKEIGPDIAHFHGAAGLTFNYNKPQVLTIHGVNEKDARLDGRQFGRLRSFIIRQNERYGRRRCRNIIIISQYIETLLKSDIRGSTWSIENPVDQRFFEVDRTPTRTVLFGGMIRPGKRVVELIEGFAEVSRRLPESRLRLAGPEPVPVYAAECRRVVEKAGLCDRVDFLGPLSPSQMATELSTAGCLALLSRQENAPVIIGEAMAAGVPVVASPVGGVPCMVDDGETGFLVDPNDRETVAASLVRVLSDEAINRTMGQRARDRALERYELSKVTEATLAVYQAVLAQHR
ncbi:MAG: glycosyltransferase family 1 protein [Rhodospirillales bacterium]|nr:MAG: glycosyltransferase family 1 protein [Rhodospirillales bacterium]